MRPGLVANMSSYFFNVCKFDGCGRNFPNLFNLIHHIENRHINYDPEFIEQQERSQPTSLPLSYILPFILDNACKERMLVSNKKVRNGLTQKKARRHRSHSPRSSNRGKSSTYANFKSFASPIPEYTKHGLRYHSKNVCKISGKMLKYRCGKRYKRLQDMKSNDLT